MSGARQSRRADRRSRAPRVAPGERSTLVRPEFQPTLPVLLRGAGRWPLVLGAAVALTLIALLGVGRPAGAGEAPERLVHRQPDFTMLIREGGVRRVAPQGDEHVRLEGRGRFTTVTVTVGPLRPTSAGTQPTLTELPIETDRLVDALRERHEDLVILDEGRARVNGAPGYQVRHRSGPATSVRVGHEVLLVPEPPARAAGLRVSLVQHNRRAPLGPDDRRVAFEAKRAFRSVRFGTERP